MKKIQKKFSNVKEIKNGFEAEFSNAFFCCLATEQHLIQIWYVLSKKGSEHRKNWKFLRKSASLFKESSIEQDDDVNTREYPRAIENPGKGWSFFHHEGKRRVFFETMPYIPFVTVNEEPSLSHLIKFDGFKFNGYFYIKWDQSVVKDQPASENLNPYREFIKEMIDEITILEPTQRCEDELHASTRGGYMWVHGDPYFFLAWAGDDFLMGVVVKKEQVEKNDINEVTRKISYDMLD